MDYFLIELVNTLRHSTAVAEAREDKLEQELIQAGFMPEPTPRVASPPPVVKAARPQDSRDSLVSITRVGQPAAEKPSSVGDEEGLRTRLEAIGLHVGANFTER
jgi:trafficking protein particle complex subunit 6